MQFAGFNLFLNMDENSARLTHKHTKHVLRAPTGKGAPRTTLGVS